MIINQSIDKSISKDRSLILKGERNIFYNSLNRNLPSDRKVMQAIIKYLTKRKLSITSSYEDWYKVAYAISNTFTLDIGEKYFLSLCKLDNEKYNEIESKNMLIYCYKNSLGSIKFNTILYNANIKGYKTILQRGKVLKVDSD